MSNEKDNFQNHEQSRESRESLVSEGEKQRERIENAIEKRAERGGHENNLEKARHEALEQADKTEKERKKIEKEQEPQIDKKRGPISKKEREASFKATMKEVQADMSAPSRTFSKVIHNPTVEKISEVTGNTIARPNALLSGAVSAFLFTLAIYLIARYYGYPLSGAESIAAFALGWLVGILYDFLKRMITGKK